MNVLEKAKESQGQQNYFRFVNRDFLLSRGGFADYNSTTLLQYRAFSPPDSTPDFPGFPEFKSTTEPEKTNFTLHIYRLYTLKDSERTCNDANIPSVSITSSCFNSEWQMSLPSAVLPKVKGAPDWLLQRMETLRRMPSPTLEEVRMQLKASAEVEAKFDGKLMS